MAGTSAGARKGWATRRAKGSKSSDYSYEIIQAFGDWLSGRAYLDNNGNYRRRSVSYDGYFVAPTRPAPWNRAVKKRFGKAINGRTNVAAFDREARYYAKKHQLDIPRYKHYGSRMHDPKGLTHRSFVY